MNWPTGRLSRCTTWLVTTRDGATSNGSLWQFGKLEGQRFTRDVREYVLTDLAGLMAVWNGVFACAKEQMVAPALASA